MISLAALGDFARQRSSNNVRLTVRILCEWRQVEAGIGRCLEIENAGEMRFLHSPVSFAEASGACGRKVVEVQILCSAPAFARLIVRELRPTRRERSTHEKAVSP